MRRSEHKQLVRKGDTRLAGSRYHWSWREETIAEDEREAFAALKESGQETNEFKDSLGLKQRGEANR